MPIDEMKGSRNKIVPLLQIYFVLLSLLLNFWARGHKLMLSLPTSQKLMIRVIWILVFVISFWCMLKVFRGIYKSYDEDAISFVTETAYLNWNTTFPAITLCEITGANINIGEGDIEGNVEYDSDEDKKNDDDPFGIEQFLSDIIFFTGSCYSCNSPCSTCLKLNFTETVQKYRKKCPDLLRECKWSNQIFDCCEKFLPLETEYGVCYSINSLHTRSNNEIMMSNRKTGPGNLVIEAAEDVRLYLHAPEDVPFINSDPDNRKDVMLGESYNITILVTEIENDENVKYLPVDKRECRFPWEKPEYIRVHGYYSYSTCVVQCHVDAHYRLCNCTHHLMPVYNREKYCDIEGLKCLTDNFETVNRLHAKGFDKPGLVCDCLPSCVEPEYKVVADTKGVRASFSEISIRMQSLPSSRFKRIVVRTTMDLVVSIGGAAGLFIGASILSIVETAYLLLLRRKVD